MRYNMIMVMWGMMAWWYTEGWRQCAWRVKERLEATFDFFSIDLLLRTLFSPFRQISAGQVRGPLNIQMRAFFDRLISRCIGLIVRVMMIVVGSLTIGCSLLAGGILLAAWAVVPLMPLLGLVLWVMGWMPWAS